MCEMVNAVMHLSFLFQASQWLVHHSMCIPKILAIIFPTDCCVFERFGALSSGLSHCFAPSRDSGVPIVVDLCFIHRHKSTQKLFQIAVKIGQILLRSGHTNAFLVDCEQSRNPSCTNFSHAQMCMWNIDQTLSWDGCDLNYVTHYHFQVIQNNIMYFINHFWCSALIWTTWTWYSFCARTTTPRFPKPLLNHSVWRSRVRIIFIELGLGFW